MKYVYAVVVAIVLTVLMFVFMDVTSRQTEVWDNQGVELPVYRRLQVSASMMIANYWIYFARTHDLDWMLHRRCDGAVEIASAVGVYSPFTVMTNLRLVAWSRCSQR